MAQRLLHFLADSREVDLAEFAGIAVFLLLVEVHQLLLHLGLVQVRQVDRDWEVLVLDEQLIFQGIQLVRVVRLLGLSFGFPLALVLLRKLLCVELV